jgi:hypothetical protein
LAPFSRAWPHETQIGFVIGLPQVVQNLAFASADDPQPEHRTAAVAIFA